MVVVFSKEEHMKEVKHHDQLHDDTYYQKLIADPTIKLTTDIKQFIYSLFKIGLISEETSEFLVFHHPPATIFYLYSKPGNLGRPLVSLNNALVVNLSHFVNFFLQTNIAKHAPYF